MFESNIRSLCSLWPGFRREIADKYAPHPAVRIIPTETGESALSLEGRFLSTRRDPVREAERIIEARFPAAPDIAVFLHFGLGYELEAFFRRYPDTPVILLEPDIPLFMTALDARDFSTLFRKKGLVLLLDTPPSSLATVLNDRCNDTVELFPIKSIARLHPDYLEALNEWFHRFQSRREINRNTLKRFGRVWVRNLLSNLQVLAEAVPLGELEGILDGRPCLVLAAGPSLDTLSDHIHELRKRMALIAVDTSAAWCRQQDIQPDFLVVVDPQYWNTRHLDPVDREQILVSESSTHPAVFRRITGPRFFCSSLFPLGSFLEKDLNIHGKLGAGGSVSTTAWDLARFLGAGKVFCAGLDLGYPDNRTHYSGSLFEELSHIWSCRANPSMTQHFRYIRDGSPLTTESNSGEPVLSDRRLSLYRWWFENRMSEPGSPATFTLSRKGVLIRGMEHAGPLELLKLPEIREELDTLLPGRDYRRLPGDIDTSAIILKGLTELDTSLMEMEILCRRALGILDNPAGSSSELLAALGTLDTEIMANPAKDIAGFLLDAEPEAPEDPFVASRKVYTSILDSVLYHREHLQRARGMISTGP
ncbi:6-hydroxymethylpterin diphosphokinase MptE-like protein [Marispirochaeta aestuarii]|uniref:motility associated factor glycosyltransferase family protein n=1 Tax=Marispirochaeta aestuarii TaxID=1963862 RepID=UPI0029C7A9CC|nr:6-hydroxymethylpterin diphosphokinase MptE-like protein [Marispirochaeta aestuarii]